MGSIVKLEKNAIINIKHNNKIEIAKPFEKEIYLFTTYVAGTYYIEGLEELSETMSNGDVFDLFREPDNIYDKKAIVVKTKNGIKIGYIPRHDNEIISRLMDAGKKIYATINNIDNNSYLNAVKIDIKIFLKD